MSFACKFGQTNHVTNNLKITIMKTRDWEKLEKIKLFEIEVIDKRTNEKDYILFDISLEGDMFIAKHVSLTKDQERSEKVSFVSVDIDWDFSLDENLQYLYEACINAIVVSDFYILSD